MKKSPWFCVLLVALVAGCATPSSRIKKNPELFASFPLEAQALIQQGRVAIGFEPAMVEMALGEPNRVYARETGGGKLEVWSYTTKQVKTERQYVNADFRYRDATGRSRTTTDWIWVDVNHENEYEQMRVEFTGGKVSAVETLTR